MRIFCRLTLATSLIGALGAGCAINPVSRRPEFVLVSERREMEIGQEQAQKIEQEIGFVDNAALTAYVESIGQRLAAHSPRQDVQYRFYVVDTPEPNAFALPGGYVYVTRGLLALVNSEDELAGVLGHEIGHVAARHSVEQVTRAAPFALVTNLSAAVVGLASPLLGQVVGGVGGLASGLVLAPFSREQEREADRVGQQMAAAGGWDPAAMANMLRTLGREQELQGNAPNRFSFLATHPSPPERVANTAAYAKELTRAPSDPISGTRAAFLARLDGLVVGPGAAGGVFEGQSFLQPDLSFVVRFPERWSTQNGRRAVGAVSPDQSALVMLRMVGEGDDPLKGARALEKGSGSSVVANTTLTTIGGLQAARTRARARTDSGDVVLELAWIAYDRHIYEFLGIAPIRQSDTFQPVYDGVVQSFRKLRAEERAGIREDHLRVVDARQGESFAALVARSKGSWSVAMASVANGFAVDTPLQAGPVKVAVTEAYRVNRVE